jgi:bisphosphoglycerate-dependent phosphoglycerate mutase
MFLNYLKGFSVKKILKNSLLNVKNSSFSGNVKTIGLVVDESYFAHTSALIEEFVANGIAKENIELLLYKSKSNVNLTTTVTKLESSYLNWNGQIKNKAVNEFIAKEFDVLVSYYDVQKPILKLITSQSKAKFKVGFTSIDINRLMIDTALENYKLFVFELFKYLKSIK